MLSSSTLAFIPLWWFLPPHPFPGCSMIWEILVRSWKQHLGSALSKFIRNIVCPQELLTSSCFPYDKPWKIFLWPEWHNVPVFTLPKEVQTQTVAAMQTLSWLKPTVLWSYKQQSKVEPFELSWTTVSLWPAVWESQRQQTLRFCVLWGLMKHEMSWVYAHSSRPDPFPAGKFSGISSGNSFLQSENFTDLWGEFFRDYHACTISVCAHAPVRMLQQIWEKCCFHRCLSTLDIKVS